MKSRGTLTAFEVSELHQDLERKLERIGVESQPEVALKLIELAGDPKTQLMDFAKAVRVDHAISGRILKLSNSAVFGQRVPVTTLERACLVLGLERLKSLSMGFYLTKSATPKEVRVIAREVWGYSVLRGCLCAELARLHAPQHVSEAFIIGLMMDAGIPLMTRMLGDGYLNMYRSTTSPGKLHRMENDLLPYTHVDVMSVLARRWKLPELLVKPIEWHHTRPADGVGMGGGGNSREEAVHRLHRVAYVASLVELAPLKEAASEDGLRELTLTGQTPGIASAQRLLSMADADITRVVDRTKREYGTMIELFSEVASGVKDVDAISEALHMGLVGALEKAMEQSIEAEGRAQTGRQMRVVVGGRGVEVQRDLDGSSTAYLYDSKGHKLLSHRFHTGAVTVAMLCEALGLDELPAGDLERLSSLVDRLNGGIGGRENNNAANGTRSAA